MRPGEYDHSKIFRKRRDIQTEWFRFIYKKRKSKEFLFGVDEKTKRHKTEP